MSSLILEDLKWSYSDSIEYNSNDDDKHKDSDNNNDIQFIFPIDESINKKMYLFCGECWKLPADAIVVGNYESLSYRGEENNPIFALAGPSFEKEVEEIESCLSGSSCIVSGGNTVFNNVIFSVGPKYDVNYDQTCDITLWSAYYSALNLAISNHSSPIKTLAICCLYLKSKKYPRDLGAHVALRTLRKYLSHNVGQKLEKIIICCNNPEDYAVYNSLMPAYFPRSFDECLLQSNILPENLGNEWGEIINEKRKITVTAGPRPSLEGNLVRPRTSVEGSNVKTGNSSLAVTWKQPRGMTEVITNDDMERIVRLVENEKNLTEEEKLDRKYEDLIMKASSENLSDIESTNFVSIVGRDRLGQSIILLTAAHINPETITMDRLLMYIMSICEPFKGLPYVLIYAYSEVKEGVNVPSGDFLNNLFELFSHRYSLHLSNFFILHPTMSLRVFLSMPYLSNRFWKNCICIDSIKGLINYIDTATIEWPLVVKNHELNF